MQQSAIDRIERELNKLFSNLNSNWIKVSSILSKLNLNLVEQRNSTYNPESLLKLHIYKRIKGIYSYDKLINNLNGEAFDLGFNKNSNNELQLPTKRYFNKFFKKHSHLKLQLDTIAKEILRISTRKGIVLDIELVNNTLKDVKNKKLGYEISDGSKTKTLRFKRTRDVKKKRTI